MTDILIDRLNELCGAFLLAAARGAGFTLSVLAVLKIAGVA